MLTIIITTKFHNHTDHIVYTGGYDQPWRAPKGRRQPDKTEVDFFMSTPFIHIWA